MPESQPFPQRLLEGAPWTFTAAQYRAACTLLEQQGVSIPQGTITQNTIDAIIHAVRGPSHRASSGVRVLLLAFTIARIQAAEEKERGDIWAQQATKNADEMLTAQARVRELEEETLRKWGQHG